MALAYLCATLRQKDPNIKISDNPISAFRGIVVDHGLREGSYKEAHAVIDALRTLGISGDVLRLNWTAAVLGDYAHPKELPNFESVARRLRYRQIGGLCSHRRIASLLLAHHEDDQYETVLMRLLQGHGSRGLRGMKKASDIPECEGMYGAYQSGYVDDQKRRQPFYNYNVPKRELKSLRRELRSTISDMMHEEERQEIMMEQERDSSSTGSSEEYDYGLEEQYQSKRVIPLDVENIDVEDGGIAMYRPLLEFSKDRLIATCLENKIPWWEDQTNHDATLTLRNAVRHLYKGHDLPKALQKPAILDLSRGCESRAQAQEAAANRLLSRAIIHEFEPSVGAAVVQIPHFEPLNSRRETMCSAERRQARISQQREIAGIYIQKILALVSPELQPPPLINLQNVISRLFPSLASPSEAALLASPAKAFSIAGVHVIPVEPNPRRQEEGLSVAASSPRQPLNWYLTRTPYPSNLPLPRFRMPYWSVGSHQREQYYNNYNNHNNNSSRNDHRYPMGLHHLQYWPWSRWMRWELWDNRFWIRLTHRLPYRIVVQPFAKEHGKPLRELLDPDDRARLAALLKRYAPGKVRYTLPAIYLEEDLDLEDVKPRSDYPAQQRSDPDPNPDPDLNLKLMNLDEGEEGEGEGEKETAMTTAEDNKDRVGRKSRAASIDPNLRVPDISKMKLLALPTLDVQIPRLNEWLHYEVRYRRVDRGTLETAGTFHRGSLSLRRRRVRRRKGVLGANGWDRG